MASEQDISKSDRILSEIKLLRERQKITDVDEPQLQVVMFSLAGDMYAFPGRNVLEILPREEVSPIPGTPSCIIGLIIVRGDIESVVDLGKILDLPATEGRESFVLLAASGTVRSGVQIDQVEDVVEVPQSAILAAPATLDSGIREFVAGQFEHEGKSVTLLDLEKIFAQVAAA